ncbi:hypothetical protein [Glycomyces buryatensis]|uniref:Uncharacterized protein n=1 Tax=Glycomyces buryatensis TaxID=2570927 RepID=A0A4S8QIM4_9ACTN|nr:hypothetical protein [Glycomyces buryatensis]THV40584.1 hypothetical protein FAB82_15065 [Glycomyces buryatensis]
MGRDITLGRGRVGHTSWERHSDRWGSVFLVPGPGTFDERTAVDFAKAPVGKVGELRAIVTVPYRPGRPPRTEAAKKMREHWRKQAPKQGTVFVLGHGELFAWTLDEGGRVGETGRKVLIGVKPLDGRDEDWLDLTEVGRVDEVELFFREGGEPR